MKDVVLDFLKMLQAELPNFGQAIAQRRFDELARLAHWLKGTGGTMGYVELSRVAERLESCAADRDLISCQRQLQWLRQLVDRIPAAV
jgi:HPt (histidine-containing phosphotransfer) domain-containing protein